MGLTFEQVWATIQRIAEKHEKVTEQHEKTERFLKESKIENDKLIRELRDEGKEAGRRMKELQKKYGGVR
jgi:hypothetical protein